VICSGSNYNANEARIEDVALVFSKKERAKLLQKYTDQIHAAKSVMIIGGGATGVECAAEVEHKYGKDKKISISNNQDRLLAGYTQKASNLCMTHFKSS
jgi:NADH dehydrogenase FAD-containing subunit